jgi:hypothetical protein
VVQQVPVEILLYKVGYSSLVRVNQAIFGLVSSVSNCPMKAWPGPARLLTLPPGQEAYSLEPQTLFLISRYRGQAFKEVPIDIKK